MSPLFYANKYVLRNFVRSAAGGRLPPPTVNPLFCTSKYILRNFVRSSAGRRGRRSALTPGFFHRYSARNNQVSAVESHRKRYNISFSRLPPLQNNLSFCRNKCFSTGESFLGSFFSKKGTRTPLFSKSGKGKSARNELTAETPWGKIGKIAKKSEKAYVRKSRFFSRNQ